jgi:hypothetical protein
VLLPYKGASQSKPFSSTSADPHPSLLLFILFIFPFPLTVTYIQRVTYDGNGNLTQDKNKGITQITYLYNNLVSTVNFGPKGWMMFDYDAEGNKGYGKSFPLKGYYNRQFFELPNHILQYKELRPDARIRHFPFGKDI